MNISIEMSITLGRDTLGRDLAFLLYAPTPWAGELSLLYSELSLWVRKQKKPIWAPLIGTWFVFS
jgi:hypothetical protein